MMPMGYQRNKKTSQEKIIMTDWLVPLAFLAGFVLLWLFVLPRLKGGT
jgi:hypothetical protein